MIIQADGRHHFAVTNLQLKYKGNIEEYANNYNVSTEINTSILESLGYKVIRINREEWCKLPYIQNKKSFIKKLISDITETKIDQQNMLQQDDDLVSVVQQEQKLLSGDYFLQEVNFG